MEQVEQVKENMLKTLIFQCFLMFHLRKNKWNKYEINGTSGTNAPRLLLFLPVKPAQMQNNPHTRKACACFGCNPAGEHAVRSNTVTPPGTGRDVVTRHKSNVTLEFLA